MGVVGGSPSFPSILGVLDILVTHVILLQ
jgi:hypothetical protein